MARLSTGMIVGLVGVALCAGPAAAQELKIGYVNLAKVFDEYQRTKDSEQVLAQKGKQRQGELEGRVGELKKLRQGLELLNDQTKDAKVKELEEKSDEFQRVKTRAERDLLRERNEIARTILDEVEKSVVEYAKTNGLSVVFDQRSLVYAQDAYNLTDEVLQSLNSRYAAKSGKPAGKGQGVQHRQPEQALEVGPQRLIDAVQQVQAALEEGIGYRTGDEPLEAQAVAQEEERQKGCQQH